MRDWVYRPVIGAAIVFFKGLGIRFDVRGAEHLPEHGGAVLASNHVSYLDFMFVGLAARGQRKRLVRFMAKQAVFDHRVSGPLMRGMHHIPVDRTAGAAAYRHAVDALRAGEFVGVFPEQTISRSFVPRPMKSGAARMALEAGVPLIPVVTWGGHRIWTSGHKPNWRRRGVPVAVWVDKPLPSLPGETAVELTDRLAARLRELVDEVLVSYPHRPDPDESWWLPAHLGGAAPTPEQAAEIEHRRIHGEATLPGETAS